MLRQGWERHPAGSVASEEYSGQPGAATAAAARNIDRETAGFSDQNG